MAFVKGAVDEEDNLDPIDIPPVKDEVSNALLDSLEPWIFVLDESKGQN